MEARDSVGGGRTGGPSAPLSRRWDGETLDPARRWDRETGGAIGGMEGWQGGSGQALEKSVYGAVLQVFVIIIEFFSVDWFLALAHCEDRGRCEEERPALAGCRRPGRPAGLPFARPVLATPCACLCAPLRR
jgi:hypothetical protein